LRRDERSTLERKSVENSAGRLWLSEFFSDPNSVRPLGRLFRASPAPARVRDDDVACA